MEQALGSGFALKDLADEEILQSVRKKLDMVQSTRIHHDPDNIAADGPNTSQSVSKVLGKAKGLRLMGRSFESDSYMLRHRFSPHVGTYVGDPKKTPFTVGRNGGRTYPRALDAMALLGSREALEILTEEGDTSYQDFSQRFDEVKDKFDSLTLVDWNFDRHWSWLYPIQALLQETANGYPKFATTKAWQRRQLSSSLASWTQLGHDTVFHRKRSFGIPPIRYVGGRPLPRLGYVEPAPAFWGRLLSLTRMIHKGLSDLKVLTPQSQERLKSAESFLEQTCKIAVRQLKSARISSKDRRYFDKLPSSIGSIVQPKKEEKQRPKVTIIADVYANQSEAMVVQAAVGKIDLMIVACPMTRGRAFLAVGPVLSFYEFKRPMGDRLTDEKWLQLLDAPIRPDRPEWYSPLVQRDESVSTNKNKTNWKRLTDSSSIVGRLDWSPDGKKIAFAARTRGQYEIYVMNADGTRVQRLMENPARDINPSSSLDGERIAFDSDRDGQSEIYIMSIDGSGVQRLTDNTTADTHPDWSPAGKQIVFMSERNGNEEIYVMSSDGRRVKRLTENPALDVLPSWSPTVEQIAFMSKRDGNSEIYVMNADGSGQKKLTHNQAGDTGPSWSPDGKKLAFHSFI
jgi:WD40 repeat protein